MALRVALGGRKIVEREVEREGGGSKRGRGRKVKAIVGIEGEKEGAGSKNVFPSLNVMPTVMSQNEMSCLVLSACTLPFLPMPMPVTHAMFTPPLS